MGCYAGFWAVTVTGLKHGPMWVLTRGSIGCFDETGLLKWEIERFAYECRLTVRSLETHLPLLAGCGLLEHANEGFRVTGWLRSRSFAEIFSEKFSEKRESTKEKKEFCLKSGNTPPTPSRNFRRAKETVAPIIQHISGREFAVAHCNYCGVGHDWNCEPYYDSQMRDLACPEFVVRLTRR